MTLKITMTFMFALTYFYHFKGHDDLFRRFDLVYDPKTPKGHRVIRGRLDLLNDPLWLV